MSEQAIGMSSRDQVLYDEAVDATRSVVMVREHVTKLREMADDIAKCLKNGNKVLWFGNGGSAAMAQHLSAELVGRFKRERAGLASIALTADTAALTAISNDYGYDYVFERQVVALCRPADVVIGFTTSGESVNVQRGLSRAAEMGAVTVCFTNEHAMPFGRMNPNYTPVQTVIGFRDTGGTARIQEAHLVAGHLLVGEVERIICTDG